MRLKGNELSAKQRDHVLNAYGYRWTIENHNRAVNWFGRLKPPTIELISDEQWLAEHCFDFIRDGSRTRFGAWAMPAYMAD